MKKKLWSLALATLLAITSFNSFGACAFLCNDGKGNGTFGANLTVTGTLTAGAFAFGTPAATGLILRSNGTAWVASQSSYPDLVGSGNVLFATAANTVGSDNGFTYAANLLTAHTLTVSTGSFRASSAGPHSFGGAPNSAVQLLQTGSFAGPFAYAVETTLTPAANNNAALLITSSAGTINKAGSGSATDFDAVSINPPTIGANAGSTLTNASALRIVGPPSGATNNYAFKIDASTAVRWAGYGSGAATFDASGNITSVSDPVAKRNIRPFTRGLADVIPINPILHGYTKESGLDQTRTDYAGFDAVNVQKTIPEAVGKNQDEKDKDGKVTRAGYLTLNPFVILAASVNAIKELNDEVAKLKARIAILEGK